MIARLLNRFAAWALEHRPVDSPSSKQPARIGAYVITDYTDGSPYITRVLLPRVFGIRPLLHRIHKPDSDRAMHNHPWRWAFSVVLAGSYDEERPVKGRESFVQTRRVSRWNLIRSTDFHRISHLHGEVWTLFITGPRIQDWGFRERAWGSGNGWRVTPHRDYIARMKGQRR